MSAKIVEFPGAGDTEQTPEALARNFFVGGARQRHQGDQVAQKIDPRLPLTKAERLMFGDTFRLPLSGWPAELGSGARSPAEQDQEALRRIAAEQHRPQAIPMSEFSQRPLGSPDTSKPWGYK